MMLLSFLLFLLLCSAWPNAADILQGEPLDYFDYHELTFPPFDSSLDEQLSHATVSKCLCGSLEVIQDRRCIAHETFVKVRTNAGFDIPVNTTKFKHVITSELRCPSDQAKVRMGGMSFFIYPSGDLGVHNWLEFFSISSYCIEHALGDDGNLFWWADICLPPPRVPRCCKAGQVIDTFTWRCISTSRPVQSFDPPIIVGQNYSYFVANYSEVSSVSGHLNHLLSCSEFQTLNHASIQSANLYYKPDGVFLIWNPSGMEYSLIPPQDYCIAMEDSSHGTEYVATICIPNKQREYSGKCSSGICVSKCCPLRQHYSMVAMSCVASNNPEWKLQFYNSVTLKETSPPDNYTLFEGQPLCENWYLLRPSQPGDEFILLDNGSIALVNNAISVPGPEYCIDDMEYPDSTYREAMVCFPKSASTTVAPCPVKELLTSILLLVSCFFLLVTLVVYMIIPELHAKLHGKSLICHASSLFFAYLSLFILRIGASHIPLLGCEILALIVQFSFLSSFFWLNVMCFDIWLTLRVMLPAADVRSSSNKRFIKYCVYAWGCPLIISLVTTLMEFLPSDDTALIVPGFGDRGCWFSEPAARWLYFYGFIVVITVINLFLFIQVAIILLKAQKNCESILRTSSAVHKERVWLYLKLFIVMGVTWLAEVISYSEGSCMGWIVTDTINSLQGFFIFVIFTCKRTIIEKVRTRTKMTRASSSNVSSSQNSKRTAVFSLESTRKSSVNTK